MSRTTEIAPRGGARRRARAAALCMLYQHELSGDHLEDVVTAYIDGLAEDELPPQSRRFAEFLLRGVVGRRDELDELIRQGSQHWRIERMAVVDRNVLRLALFELLCEPDTPAAVILDEAVELAKLFGTEESGAFVNGVVDGIRRQLAEGRLVRR